MARRVVVDSGPLVALFDRDDQHHQRSLQFLKRFKGELLSNLAVMTEVMYLLDFSLPAQIDFLTWTCSGAIHLVDLTESDLVRVIEILKKYADLPPDFTDATLVAICERTDTPRIATFDADFEVYRLHGRRKFQVVTNF